MYFAQKHGTVSENTKSGPGNLSPERLQTRAVFPIASSCWAKSVSQRCNRNLVFPKPSWDPCLGRVSRALKEIQALTCGAMPMLEGSEFHFRPRCWLAWVNFLCHHVFRRKKLRAEVMGRMGTACARLLWRKAGGNHPVWEVRRQNSLGKIEMDSSERCVWGLGVCVCVCCRGGGG